MQPPLDKDGKPAKGLWRVIPQMNHATGRTSTSQTDFSDRRFSSRTTYFIECADCMAAERLRAVVAAAEEYSGLKHKVINNALNYAVQDDNREELLEDGD